MADIWIVCGSRHLAEEDERWVWEMLVAEAWNTGWPKVLFHGAARGADTIADAWAKEQSSIEVRPFPADWDSLGGKAGPKRNERMKQAAARLRRETGARALCIAFPLAGEKNKGTWDMASRAGNAGIPVVVEPRTRF